MHLPRAFPSCPRFRLPPPFAWDHWTHNNKDPRNIPYMVRTCQYLSALLVDVPRPPNTSSVSVWSGLLVWSGLAWSGLVWSGPQLLTLQVSRSPISNLQSPISNLQPPVSCSTSTPSLPPPFQCLSPLLALVVTGPNPGVPSTLNSTDFLLLLSLCRLSKSSSSSCRPDFLPLHHHFDWRQLSCRRTVSAPSMSANPHLSISSSTSSHRVAISPNTTCPRHIVIFCLRLAATAFTVVHHGCGCG